MKKKTLQIILFYLIAIIVIVVYFFPILTLIFSSFKKLKEIYLNVLAVPASWKTDNYKEAMKGMAYWQTLFNSVLISGLTAGLTALFASMAGWVLARYKRKLSTVFYMMFAASMLVPFQCVMLPLMRMMNSVGMTNRAGLIFSYLGLYSSMSIILVIGYVKNIPIELEEAAAIDGCNTVQTFFMVVFPLLRTIMITIIILSIINTWNDYLLPSLIINRAGMQTLPLKTYTYISQFVKRWDLASAGMVLCIVPIMIFYISCQKYIIQGVTTGAVKG